MPGAVCRVPKDYTKREHVIEVCTPDGAEFLLQALDGFDVITWLEALQTASKLSGAPAPAQSDAAMHVRTQSVPSAPPAASEKKSLFGFGKKK
jgi:hypothetical protein